MASDSFNLSIEGDENGSGDERLQTQKFIKVNTKQNHLRQHHFIYIIIHSQIILFP